MLLRIACRGRGESQFSRDSRHELVSAVGHGRRSYRTNTSDRSEFYHSAECKHLEADKRD